MTSTPLDGTALLRHFLATLAYRGGKCLKDAPEGFSEHDTGGGKTTVKIVAHMGDLLDWSLAMAQGDGAWKASEAGTWEQEAARFHLALARLDAYLVSGAPVQADLTRLLQGPLADAMTHVGQLAMLRRIAGAPLARENYFKADIEAGRVGADQHHFTPRPPSA